MVIGLYQVSFSLPESRSLKDKRMVLRSIKDRTVARMNMSAAETGKHDVWKSAEMSFVTVANEKNVVEKRLAELDTTLRTNPRIVVMDHHIELL